MRDILNLFIARKPVYGTCYYVIQNNILCTPLCLGTYRKWLIIISIITYILYIIKIVNCRANLKSVKQTEDLKRWRGKYQSSMDDVISLKST